MVDLPQHNFLVALHSAVAEGGSAELELPERSKPLRPIDFT